MNNHTYVACHGSHIPFSYSTSAEVKENSTKVLKEADLMSAPVHRGELETEETMLMATSLVT